MSRPERELTQYERLLALEADQKHRIARGVRAALGAHETNLDFEQYLDPNIAFYHDAAARRMGHEMPGIRMTDEAIAERRSQMLIRLSVFATSLVHETSQGADAIIIQFPGSTITDAYEERPLPAVGN